MKAADASIEVDGVEGGLDLYSVSGSVRVRGAPATVRAESMEGPISIEARTPWLRAKTASGSIDLAGEVSDLAAASVSGTIRVAAARQARARIESVTGEIVVSGRPTRGGAWEIETHSGPVTLVLAPDTDAEIDVHTFGGDVRSSWADRNHENRRLGGERLVDHDGFGGNFDDRADVQGTGHDPSGELKERRRRGAPPPALRWIYSPMSSRPSEPPVPGCR